MSYIHNGKIPIRDSSPLPPRSTGPFASGPSKGGVEWGGIPCGYISILDIVYCIYTFIYSYCIYLWKF